MIRALVVVLGFVWASGPALGQVVKNGNVNGTVVSGSGVSASGGMAGTILTAPPSGAFVLTQICTVGTPGANNEDSLRVVGNTVGVIAQSYGDDTLGSCTTYTPGVAIPPGEVLECAQLGVSASAGTCTVTGVLSKK